MSARRPATVTPTCRICGGTTNCVGHTDFNKSGADWFEGERQFPSSDEQVHYYRCIACGFMFTDFFDEWTPGDFRTRVYNGDYLLADPPFAGERASKMATFLGDVLGPGRQSIHLLDYGSGTGAMVEHLHGAGYTNSVAYDPYHASPTTPTGQFNLVTAFEVVEHVSDQTELFARLSKYVSDDGALVFSTLLQPDDIEALGARWWYACPRNAHMSFHTQRSLSLILERFEMHVESLTDEIHVASRRPNPLSRRFLSAGIAVQVNE